MMPTVLKKQLITSSDGPNKWMLMKLSQDTSQISIKLTFLPKNISMKNQGTQEEELLI